MVSAVIVEGGAKLGGTANVEVGAILGAVACTCSVPGASTARSKCWTSFCTTGSYYYWGWLSLVVVPACVDELLAAVFVEELPLAAAA